MGAQAHANGSVDLPLIASPDRIYGLGRLVDSQSPAIIVDFHGHQDWEIRWENQLLIRTELGMPRLPQEAMPEARFRDNVGRLFPTSNNVDHSRLWEVGGAGCSIFDATSRLPQGRPQCAATAARNWRKETPPFLRPGSFSVGLHGRGEVVSDAAHGLDDLPDARTVL
jgi:hypothetical protein